MPVLTNDILLSLLDYDSLTGIFTWKIRHDVRQSWNGRYAGRRAGYEYTATGGGRYRYVPIFDWPFHEHRLAWLYMTGELPSCVVDHIDLDGTNNCWSNLRNATRSQNEANSRSKKNSKIGLKGVTWHSKARKYRATISLNGSQKWLGYFNTPQDAHAAYCNAATAMFGEFARGA